MQKCPIWQISLFIAFTTERYLICVWRLHEYKVLGQNESNFIIQYLTQYNGCYDGSWLPDPDISNVLSPHQITCQVVAGKK